MGYILILRNVRVSDMAISRLVPGQWYFFPAAHSIINPRKEANIYFNKPIVDSFERIESAMRCYDRT